ncbi:hypothetical protein J3E69DRAFT_342538 [Trichoderma sp. SZMC 28015]
MPVTFALQSWSPSHPIQSNGLKPPPLIRLSIFLTWLLVFFPSGVFPLAGRRCHPDMVDIPYFPFGVFLSFPSAFATCEAHGVNTPFYFICGFPMYGQANLSLFLGSLSSGREVI